MTYSPVSRSTRNELALNQRRVRAQVSGSCRCSHSSFGPAACDDRADPARARMLAPPSRSVSSAASAVARVSIPYRMAGRSGRPALSHASRHGPRPLMPTARIADRPTRSSASRACSSSQDCSHQTACASCSNQPGRGWLVPCGPVTVASTVPSGSTATALVLDVPMSRPMTSSVMLSPPRPGASGRGCASSRRCPLVTWHRPRRGRAPPRARRSPPRIAAPARKAAAGSPRRRG